MRGATILFLSLLLLAGCDSIGNANEEEYLAQARESLDKGDFPVARINLKNVLKENPNNSQARFLLGHLYVDVGNGPTAEKELRKARELGVADGSVVPLLARALLQQNEYQKVLELDADSSFSNETAAEILASRGTAYLMLRESDNARRELDNALKKEPDSVYALVGRARLSVIQQNFEEARTYLDQAFKINPDYAFAWSLLGDMNRLENKQEAAIKAYTEAINNSNNINRDLLQRAMLFMQEEQYDKAQSDINELKKHMSGHPKVNFVQGLIYLRQKKIIEAQELFEQVLRINPDNMLATYYLGATQFISGNFEQAKNNLSRFVFAYPHALNARKLLALISLKQKDFKATEEMIRPVVSGRSDDVDALNILAESLLYQGNLNEMIPIVEKSINLKPDSVAARTLMGIGLMRQGKEEAGAKSLESAIEIDPQFLQAEVQLILNYLQAKSYDKAQQAAEAFVEKQPDKAIAYNLLGKTYLARGNEDEAEAAFEKARQLAPGDPFASRNLAILALRKQDPDKARAYLNEVLEHHQGHLSTMLLLAALEEREGEDEASKVVLRKAIELHPNTVTPRVLLARQYLSEGKTDQVFALLNEEIRVQHRNNPVVIGILGQAELDSRSFKKAKITYQHLIELRPNLPQAHFQLAKAYGGLNDSDGLIKELQKTLALAPEHLNANIVLTRTWLREGNLTRAKEQLASLKVLAPNLTVVLALEGEILSKSGESDKALAAYRALFAAKPNTGNLLRLTQLQWRMGKREASINQIESWINQHPDDLTARQALASAYIKLNRPRDAMAQYDQILKISENNPVALNDLAWLLRESDPDRALQLAKKASSIAPQSVSIKDTLAAILLIQGDTAGAQSIIENGLEIKPGSPTLLYRRAMLLEATGKADEAIVELDSLLKKNPEFPGRAEVERMIQRLKGG